MHGTTLKSIFMAVFVQLSIAADPLTVLTNSASHSPKIHTGKFKFLGFKNRTLSSTMERTCLTSMQNFITKPLFSSLQWQNTKAKREREKKEPYVFLSFIVAPCIIESIYCSLTNKCTFYSTWKSLNLYWNKNNYRSYMFRFSTILRELVQSLAKVTLLLLH